MLNNNDDIDIEHIETDKQKGDILTKGLARPKHEPACKMVGLYPFLFQAASIYDSEASLEVLECYQPIYSSSAAVLNFSPSECTQAGTLD